MVLSTETLNQSVRTEYLEAVNACYTFQPLWVSDCILQVFPPHTKPLKWGLTSCCQCDALTN